VKTGLKTDPADAVAAVCVSRQADHALADIMSDRKLTDERNSIHPRGNHHDNQYPFDYHKCGNQLEYPYQF